ncbi:MAG TPA: SAM-dependent chlorinase/fluorinase [Flavilitoribacter sp.]|nr:SAM-dependent chlorinase/fluorinase [Flavilitoribacter sp.]
MPIVTLTTDFGWQDPYLPRIKGGILRQNAGINLVDITHDIECYDIVQAAYLFRNVWGSFPEGTIHLVSVNDFYQADCRYLAISHEGHYFLGPDNGLFSLIFQEMPAHTFELPAVEQHPLQLIDIYPAAIGHIVSGKPFNAIGTQREAIEHRITFQPVLGPAYIRGTVIRVDHFDNVVTNISKVLFEKVGQGRKFKLVFKRHEAINNLCLQYHDVPVGETLCLFNSSDLLEIAINMGKAASLLGLKVEDTVQVDFELTSG